MSFAQSLRSRGAPGLGVALRIVPSRATFRDASGPTAESSVLASSSGLVPGGTGAGSARTLAGAQAERLVGERVAERELLGERGEERVRALVAVRRVDLEPLFAIAAIERRACGAASASGRAGFEQIATIRPPSVSTSACGVTPVSISRRPTPRARAAIQGSSQGCPRPSSWDIPSPDSNTIALRSALMSVAGSVFFFGETHALPFDRGPSTIPSSSLGGRTVTRKIRPPSGRSATRRRA